MRYPASLLLAFAFALAVPAAAQPAAEAIPLPEHPRPDFERPDWLNLNGTWRFRFDKEDAGVGAGWFRSGLAETRPITVPFSWGAPLSGVPDEGDVGWYERTVTVPAGWDSRRVFLVVGAADWRTTAWLDGNEVGTHQGGYTPFAFELTHHLRPGQAQRLVLRVDDTAHDFKLEGKQGYGKARGIWQTPYLEARGTVALDHIHFSPDLAGEKVVVAARLSEPAPEALTLRLAFPNGEAPAVVQAVAQGAQDVAFDVALPGARLWSLEDPYLHRVDVTLGGGAGAADHVGTYFGMREVSVVDLPGTGYRYVSLNGEPVYLQLALDQAYHPEGFYTFPSDAFTRDEVLRARQIGLNGIRVHVKVGLPRKLYWADRLGVLVMADVPNSWGEPTPEQRQETEHALRGMIARDYNHPAIFAWVPFNETWGLYTRTGTHPNGDEKWEYLPETQQWVASVYRLAKSLDPTRLVEDNSVCCGRGHTETDLNSWHAYLPGWDWTAELDSVSAGAYPGSTWNFEAGYRQDRQPVLNSEFGNVWGYEGSTGDVDWSWDYHRAVNAFRRHPKVAGWLYTEHHDVVNEWNGYWRYDRSEKFTGMDELAAGMTLRDLHAPLYVAVGDPAELSRVVAAGETVDVPLWASFLTGADHGAALTLRARLYGWNTLGQEATYWTGERRVDYRPWTSDSLPPLRVRMPAEPAVAVLAVALEDAAGTVLHRNFTTFVVGGTPPAEVTLEGGRRAHVVRWDPAQPVASAWSMKQWDVLDGLKVNGAGAGHFTYRVPWPAGLRADDVAAATFVVEASAKQLFGKDREGAGTMEGDYMKGLGTFDPSLNPNAYPMTDQARFPSAVTVRVNGEVAGRFELHDDPADHRGILSWHAQLRDGRLREAGSYGQLLRATVPPAALARAAAEGAFEVRLEVDGALPGGLAIYGARFGRYPVDPTLLLIRK